MAKKTTVVKTLEDKIFTLQSALDVAKEMRDLNPEDHPVSSATKRKATAAEKKEEGRMKIRIKRRQEMLKKAKSPNRGGGGGGNIGMLSQSGVQSLIKPKADFKR